MTMLRRVLTVNGVLGAAFLVFALLAPRLISNITFIEILITANIFAMFAASWDILSGFTGQENFGHAAFIGAGGFTVGLFTKYADIPLESALVLGAVSAAILGLLIGIPCLRLHGPYLALATLAAATALLRIAFVFKSYTGGEEGISPIPNLGTGTITGGMARGLAKLFGPAGFDELRRIDKTSIVNYYVVLVAMVLIVGALAALGASKRGLVLRSIQQDAGAAEASGVPTTRYKLAAFVISSACAGFAGSLWVHTLSNVNIDTLRVDLSLLIIVIAIVGGAGTIIGPAVGAYLIVVLQDYVLKRVGIEEGSQLQPMLFSAALIVVLILQPHGLIAPLLRRLSGKRLLLEPADA
jgi:branched-chain amino acid transport system permease protein